MRVLLTGASGFVGRHVAAELSSAGHEVRCLVRRSSESGHLVKAGLELVHGDLADRAALRAAVRGTGAVAHVAGLVRARVPADLYRANARGTAELARAAREESGDAARFLLVSSQAAAGPSTASGTCTEDDEPRPVSWYGRSKLAGERAARRVLGADGALTVIRPPAVYGPHDSNIFEFFQAAHRGISLRVGCRTRRISIVHCADLAVAIRLALETEAARGRTYFVANPEPRSLDDLLAEISRAVGRAGVRVRIPGAALRAAALAADEVCRVLGLTPKLSRDKAREFLVPGWVCSSDRARRELGWEPRIDLDEGLASTAAWYHERGWL